MVQHQWIHTRTQKPCPPWSDTWGIDSDEGEGFEAINHVLFPGAALCHNAIHGWWWLITVDGHISGRSLDRPIGSQSFGDSKGLIWEGETFHCFSPWRPGGLPYWTHKLSYPSSGASLQSNRHFGLGAQLTQQAGAAGGLKSQGPLEGNRHEITSEPQSTTSPIDHWHMPKDPNTRPQIIHGSMMTPTVRNGGMYITRQ